MSFSKRQGKNTPQCYTKPLDSFKNWNNCFFWVDERVFPTVVDWCTSAPKDGMPAEDAYSAESVRILDTHRTPIQKQPEALLCLVGLSHRYYLGDEVYPTFLHDDDRDIDLFSLIRASNPIKVKTRSHPRTAHEVPLLTVTANRVIEMEDPATATDLSGVAVTIERGALEAGQAKGVAATGPSAIRESRNRGHDGIDANAPPKGNVATRDLEFENAFFASVVGSPESIYRPEWVQRKLSLASGDGVQLRLRFEQEAKLLKKSVAQVARRDKRIQAREHEIKNLEALLEAEADMKKVPTLQEQVSGEEKLKAAFEEFKLYEDNLVEKRCAEMDARLDALSIDFDEELYPHILTAIAGRRLMIGHGLRLAVVKCSESLEMRQAFSDVVLAGIAEGMSIENFEVSFSRSIGEPERCTHRCNYAALLLESDTGDDASQWVRELRSSSSQLTIPVYPKVRDPMNPWAYKEEMLLADAIAAKVSHVEKKKKCRIVCRTHEVGSVHHARSDGVPVSVPTIVPQGLAILLADAATQTKSNKATLNNL
nr:hypothetical protein [Tanacetum cinerariifolium]